LQPWLIAVTIICVLVFFIAMLFIIILGPKGTDKCKSLILAIALLHEPDS